MYASGFLLRGVVGFFLLERALHWHHAHLPREEVLHPVAVTNLIGDALHNFVDGSVVAGAVSGAVATLLLAAGGLDVERPLLPLTAGGFVYIASTDLIPELHKEPDAAKSLIQVAGLALGIGVIAALLVLE